MYDDCWFIVISHIWNSDILYIFNSCINSTAFKMHLLEIIEWKIVIKYNIYLILMTKLNLALAENEKL